MCHLPAPISPPAVSFSSHAPGKRDHNHGTSGLFSLLLCARSILENLLEKCLAACISIRPAQVILSQVIEKLKAIWQQGHLCGASCLFGLLTLALEGNKWIVIVLEYGEIFGTSLMDSLFNVPEGPAYPALYSGIDPPSLCQASLQEQVSQHPHEAPRELGKQRRSLEKS